jgi:hypothetical protein
MKVKLKSLAAEARIIRLEESRCYNNNELREALYLHRINDVRSESRATHIAYAYLRGQPFGCAERGDPAFWATPQGIALWKRVQAMIVKYGDGVGDPLTWRAHAPAIAA